MKPSLSLEELEQDGWEADADFKNKIAAREAQIELNNAVVSIAESVGGDCQKSRAGGHRTDDQGSCRVDESANWRAQGPCKNKGLAKNRDAL